MRISDWSSDVCSSDLSGPAQDQMRLSFGELASAHQTDMRRVIWHDEARSLCIIERIRHGKCIKFPSKRIFRERAGLVLVHRASHHSHTRSEEHTSELQSLMRISYAVFCLKKKKIKYTKTLIP